MGILSNFLGLRDGRHAEPPTTFRPVVPGEIEPSLRLILGGHGVTVTDDHLHEFLKFCDDRGIDLTLLWVAEQNGRPALAALPVMSPGRTMLLFVSPPPHKGSELTLGTLIEQTADAAAARDVQLAQALIDPQDEAMQRVYVAAGFYAMAELIYLNAAPRAGTPFPTLPPGLAWESYSPQTHHQFARAIIDTYHESLDCPALNGLRSIDDVIEGHKASGIFNPADWFILVDSSETVATPARDPLGVLLLASSGRAEDVMELIYLGLAPSCRGRQMGELLIQQALAVVALEKNRRLSLAVDAQNLPALKLYYRHGMNRVASKIAFMKNLRASPPAALHS